MLRGEGINVIQAVAIDREMQESKVTKMRFIGLMVLLGTATVSMAKQPVEVAGSLASAEGAALDSNLMKGGGTDDTVVLQRVLDRAANGHPVRLIIDGPALVSGLIVYGNTSIECGKGAGLYLKDGSNRTIIRNAHRSRDAIEDEHIAVRGCFLNGNREHQPCKVIKEMGMGLDCEHLEADGGWLSGLQFFGIDDLAIENVTVWSIGGIGGIHVANASHVNITNVTIDHGVPSDDIEWNISHINGISLNGPLRYITISGVRVRTSDDGIGCLADFAEEGYSYGPYVSEGPITDVSISNVQVMNAVSALRFVSSTQRIDRVVVSNVTGTVKGWVAVGISHFLSRNLGNIGSMTFDNINVSRSDHDAPSMLQLSAVIRKTDDKAWKTEFNNGVFPLFFVNAHAESLILSHIVTKVSDDRPILRIGPDSNVRMLSADLNIDDPELRSVPLELNRGARVERMNLSVNWNGSLADLGKNPIKNEGGSITQLNWVSTPPLFVNAELIDAKTVAVTFSQDVKAADFRAGVSVKVNGRPLDIASAIHEQGHSDAVRYVLNAPVSAGEALTWAYNAADGNIQNWSGGQLLSVSEKQVRTQRDPS